MSKADITDGMSIWEYSLYNEREQKKERISKLIQKYGFPVRERNLLEEDYIEYDLLKDDLEKMENQDSVYKTLARKTSLDDEDMVENAEEREKKQNREDIDDDAEALRKIRENSQKQNIENAKDSVKDDNKVMQVKTTLANLGYYRGKIDNMATPGLTKAMNDFAQDHQINEQTLSENLDKISEKLKSVKTQARLDFDGKYLRFIQDGKLVLVLNAMSGNPDYQNLKYQNVQKKGPLPEGSYRVKQDRIQDINLKQGIGGAIIKLTPFKRGQAYGGYPAWGKTRVWLEPFSSNNMYGRDKFTIHGGATMGSAGCIDIPGHTKEFFDVLRKYGKDIILNVHYDKEKLQ